MTISLRGTATGLAGFSDTATPFANQTYVVPTGEQVGDLLITMCGAKWSTATQYTQSMAVPTDYALLNWYNEGSTTTGNGSGSAYLQLTTKTATSTAETDPVQTFAFGYSPAMLAMIAFQKTNPGAWILQSTFQRQTATASPLDVTGQATLNFEAGDVVMVVTAHNDDVTNEALSSLQIPGCTIGTVTERLATNSTAQGNDGSMWCYTATVLTGPATGAPRIVVNTNAGEANGVAIFVRIAEPPRTSDEYWGMLPI